MTDNAYTNRFSTEETKEQPVDNSVEEVDKQEHSTKQLNEETP